MQPKISRAEFVALIAMMFATIAFSIDAMLPALPDIGAELSPSDPNKAAVILTSFVFGLGLGTFFTGPLSDAFGRRSVILCGLALYAAGAALAWLAPTLELVLIGRVLQGLGAASPRIVGIAVVRDLFSGRDMARIISIAMTIFTIFPAFAPLIGSIIIATAGWRAIFLAFVVFAVGLSVWVSGRLGESLPVSNRRPFRAPLLGAAIKEMVTHPTVRLSIVVQTLCLSALFTLLTMVQPVYEQIFDKGDSFPLWFGGVALASGASGLLNAAIVGRFGMRRIVTATVGIQAVLSVAMIVIGIVDVSEVVFFASFVFWQFTLFFMAGLTMGNLNSIAMEPMGHIAGMAASVIGGISTVLGAAVASPVSLLFDGSILPLATSIAVLCCLASVAMTEMSRIEKRLSAS